LHLGFIQGREDVGEDSGALAFNSAKNDESADDAAENRHGDDCCLREAAGYGADPGVVALIEGISRYPTAMLMSSRSMVPRMADVMKATAAISVLRMGDKRIIFP
jgi:hypothetical protein